MWDGIFQRIDDVHVFICLIHYVEFLVIKDQFCCRAGSSVEVHSRTAAKINLVALNLKWLKPHWN
jgi:hypothetical protein